MAHYVLHVEGDDADDADGPAGPAVHLHQLVRDLSEAGHVVYAASITVGVARDLVKHHDGELHYEHRPQ
jgi:hypothetical protein